MYGFGFEQLISNLAWFSYSIKTLMYIIMRNNLMCFVCFCVLFMGCMHVFIFMCYTSNDHIYNSIVIWFWYKSQLMDLVNWKWVVDVFVVNLLLESNWFLFVSNFCLLVNKWNWRKVSRFHWMNYMNWFPHMKTLSNFMHIVLL